MRGIQRVVLHAWYIAYISPKFMGFHVGKYSSPMEVFWEFCNSKDETDPVFWKVASHPAVPNQLYLYKSVAPKTRNESHIWSSLAKIPQGSISQPMSRLSWKTSFLAGVCEFILSNPYKFRRDVFFFPYIPNIDKRNPPKKMSHSSLRTRIILCFCELPVILWVISLYSILFTITSTKLSKISKVLQGGPLRSL